MTNPVNSADIRLLVLDLDGTLVDEDDQIHDETLEAIQQVQLSGVEVAIATGRGFQLSLPIYEAIGSTLPLICYEGALLKDPRSNLVHRHWSLEPDTALQILDCTQLEATHFSIHLYAQDKLYVSSYNDATTRYFQGSAVQPIVVENVRALLHQPITKVRVISEDDKLIINLAKELEETAGRVRMKEFRSLTYLEVGHPEVSKRLAVSHLVESILGLQPANIIAIGNDLSDIGMLQYAGVGVAMGNASMEVKAHADHVTATIEEAGVARAVKELILQNETVSDLVPAYISDSTTTITDAF